MKHEKFKLVYRLTDLIKAVSQIRLYQIQEKHIKSNTDNNKIFVYFTSNRLSDSDIKIMRWASKVMSNSQDQNQSKLSNRSLSKFKKVNLQKSEAEIASNQHLEKSVLKLTSVEKVKTLNLNRSFISNYLPSSQYQSQQNSRGKFTQNPTEKSKQNNFNAQSSKTIQTQYPKILDFSNQGKPLSKQGFGVFQKQEKFTNKQAKITSNIQAQNPENLSLQKKLKQVIWKFQEVLIEFREISQNVKKEMDSTVSSCFLKLSEQLSAFAKKFESSFENGIQKLISFINTQKGQSQFKCNNLVKTSQIFPPSPENDSFCKIKYFEHEQAKQIESQKPQSTSRPNTFKNKFKQIIDDSSHQNFLTKNQVQKSVANGSQQERQKSTRKIIRKQTNPIMVTRVNSLFRNEPSVLNEDSFSNLHDKSTNSIKYCKVGNNKNASKSVKKLQEKLVLIKSIFSSETPSNDTLPSKEVKVLIENT